MAVIVDDGEIRVTVDEDAERVTLDMDDHVAEALVSILKDWTNDNGFLGLRRALSDAVARISLAIEDREAFEEIGA